MTVWVVHPVAQDISAAAQYGEIKYITDRYVYPDELDDKRVGGETLPEPVLAKLHDVAMNFETMKDFVMIAGDQLSLAQLLMYLAGHGGVRVLRYDREAKGYYPVMMMSY